MSTDQVDDLMSSDEPTVLQLGSSGLVAFA
jgi:hypothetical protein